MKYSFEERLPFLLLTLTVLVIFYGIYFSKLIFQHRRGIKTRRLLSSRDRKTRTVESLMSIATVCVIPAELASAVFGWSILPAGARFTGFLIGIIGDALFLVSVVCMHGSWRVGIPDGAETTLVTSGIYKFSRNPAFLGFYFMYFGVLLMYFNPLSLIFTLFAALTLHLQVLCEERYLAETFGAPYAEYRKRVFRYLGRRK